MTNEVKLLAEKNIIEKTHSLINMHGVKVLSMDEISRLLCMSKKTLYKYFKNKKDLVLKCFKHEHNQILKDIANLENNHTNVIDLFLAIDEHIIKISKSSRRNPQMIANLERYHPESFKVMNNLRKIEMISTIKRTLNKGIDQGLLRKEIKIEIITEFILSNIDTITDPNIFTSNKYNLKNVINEKRILEIRGLATAKGINYFENKRKENERK
ncbi:MAG: TetR/AcrR family transcriptional regulator [Flavobacteriales bacterium]|jgi:TetR/AcrR family transcriptional regulator, cholesterol catabolism regulator|nr:TetR/AcrR family transcriptional regulator [Flavobacteriales bacterium]